MIITVQWWVQLKQMQFYIIIIIKIVRMRNMLRNRENMKIIYSMSHKMSINSINNIMIYRILKISQIVIKITKILIIIKVHLISLLQIQSAQIIHGKIIIITI